MHIADGWPTPNNDTSLHLGMEKKNSGKMRNYRKNCQATVVMVILPSLDWLLSLSCPKRITAVAAFLVSLDWMLFFNNSFAKQSTVFTRGPILIAGISKLCFLMAPDLMALEIVPFEMSIWCQLIVPLRYVARNTLIARMILGAILSVIVLE